MNIFTQFFKGTNSEDRKQAILQDLMRREVEVTRDIFGPVPKGVRREFFCLDKHTWVWYEEWTDENGQPRQMTTRYIIRPKEILKSQNGGAYRRLTIEEALNFQKATQSYYHKIKTHLYADKKPA
ncbi:hypothetical protein KC959_00380 [Candidatus Saccharibacteria bacterium]|nr:hypothetical protein [Candidatus Saccharibacteria bacterium]